MDLKHDYQRNTRINTAKPKKIISHLILMGLQLAENLTLKSVKT